MSRRAALILATLMLVGVGLLHYGLQFIASGYVDPPYALQVLFYIGQGVKGVLLFAVIAVFMPRRLYSIPVVLVCLWGATEDFLVAGCQMARGIESVTPLMLWQGVCSSLSVGPSYLLGAIMGGVAAASILYELKHGNNQGRPSQD